MKKKTLYAQVYFSYRDEKKKRIAEANIRKHPVEPRLAGVQTPREEPRCYIKASHADSHIPSQIPRHGYQRYQRYPST